MKLEDIHKEIGTAKDNRNTPIHDWYRFTAGFSYKLIDRVIKEENLNSNDNIYESFAGCGTTLVSAQKRRIRAVGNEGQELLMDVIEAKLNWDINIEEVTNIILDINENIQSNHNNNNYHQLLESLYDSDNLYQLYVIKDSILGSNASHESKLFLKLALTQTLHKVSIHPIAIPYISRSKTLKSSLPAFEMFKKTAIKMGNDLKSLTAKDRTSEIFSHDSRKLNSNIPDDSCTICITSPPYLNNLDYGEVSKVCSHFYGITNDWGEITQKVRKNLVTGATTHYKDNEFEFSSWKKGVFYNDNKKVIDDLTPEIKMIEHERQLRKGKKSFHILVLYYFEDMYNVLLEMRRVLKPKSKAYLVLGDSAPYGIYIDTTKVLGEIALNAGFDKYRIVKIRERGTKWTSLRFRHNLKLSENILILE